MPCEFYKDDRGEFVGVACSIGGENNFLLCRVCGSPNDVLCDVCDAPVCNQHATRVAFDADVCPKHNTPDGIETAIKRRIELGE